MPAVGRENRQGEYYLNEVLPILMDKGERVSVVPVDTGGTFGVNSRDGLAAVERVVRRRINADTWTTASRSSTPTPRTSTSTFGSAGTR